MDMALLVDGYKKADLIIGLALGLKCLRIYEKQNTIVRWPLYHLRAAEIWGMCPEIESWILCRSLCNW